MRTKKRSVRKTLKTAGVSEEIIKHYSGMYDLASASGLAAYLFSDSFKGSSTDAEILMIEVVRKIDIPKLKKTEELIDYALGKWQMALDFLGNGNDNKAALSGILFGLSLFSESVKTSREREYGSSPILDAWHNALESLESVFSSPVQSRLIVKSGNISEIVNYDNLIDKY